VVVFLQKKYQELDLSRDDGLLARLEGVVEKEVTRFETRTDSDENTETGVDKLHELGENLLEKIAVAMDRQLQSRGERGIFVTLGGCGAVDVTYNLERNPIILYRPDNRRI